MHVSQKVSQASGGIYSWLVAIYFGAVLLDVTYSGLLDSMGSVTQAAFSEVSVLLLLLVGFILLMGLLTIMLSWTASTARNLFAASLPIIVVSGFLAVLVLFPLSSIAPESAILKLGLLFRLIPIGVASLMGLLGFRSLSRVPQEGAPR